MNNINFRINELVSHFSNGNNSDFAKRVGINEANIRNYISGTEPKFSFLEKVVTTFEINYEWLLTGNGEMLKSEVSQPIEIIKPVKIEGRGLMPKVVVVDSEDNERIPLVPVKAHAGYLEGYGDPEYIEKLPTYSVPNLHNGTFRMFQVAGHSMYPTLQSNSYVIGEFVQDWEYMTDNRVYVVVTENEGVIVKRVINRLKKNKTLYCKSDNRDYPHISVNVVDIKEIWECKMHLSFEFLDPVTNYQKIADLEIEMLKIKEKIQELEAENKFFKS